MPGLFGNPDRYLRLPEMSAPGQRLAPRLQRRLAGATRERAKVYRRQMAERRAADYLQAVGVAPLLVPGSSAELPPDAVDLAFLHRFVQARKPKQVLEFGVGYSTLVLAHALWASPRGKADPPPWLYVVDASQEWIDNTRLKVPPELAPYIEFRPAQACVAQLGGELCHFFKDLPNIRPKLIYVDGPDPTAVEGHVRGLRFTTEDGLSRPPVSADVLLYESTLRRGATVVIDGRSSNATFLRRYLTRRWRFQTDVVQDRHIFTLLE